MLRLPTCILLIIICAISLSQCGNNSTETYGKETPEDVKSEVLGSQQQNILTSNPGAKSLKSFVQVNGAKYYGRRVRVYLPGMTSHNRRQYIVRCCGQMSCSGGFERTSARPFLVETNTPNDQDAGDTTLEQTADTTDETATQTETAVQVTTPRVCVSNCRKPENSPQCSLDSTLVKPDGTLSIPSGLGVARVVCGRLYMLSWVSKTRDEAELSCCSLNMTLVSMEDATKSSCLLNFYKSLAAMPTTFWTSGSVGGCPGQLTWCNTGEKISPGGQWGPGEPSGKGYCVESLMSVVPPDFTVLRVNQCSLANKFICQKSLLEPIYSSPPTAPTSTAPPTTVVTTVTSSPVSCSAPTCVQPTCTINSAMVAADGTVTVPFMTGMAQTQCGRQYMFSLQPKTFADAAQYCCTLGMKLVALETPAEVTCLVQMITVAAQMMPGGAATLAGPDSFFWTSGSDEGCEGKWAWCSSAQSFSPSGWAAGSPDTSAAASTKNCGGLVMQVASMSAAIADKDCSLAAKFICEGDVPSKLP